MAKKKTEENVKEKTLKTAVKTEKPKKAVTKKSKKETFEDYIKEEKVLTGKVFSGGRNDPIYGEYVTIYLDGEERRVVIPKDELVGTQDSKMVLSFIDMEIPFIPLSVDEKNNRIIASRIKAQKKIIDMELANAKEDEVYSGTICGIMPFGVYVDVKGVQGILRNTDYSNTNIAVTDHYGLGDKIDVLIKRIYSDGNKVEFKVPVLAIDTELDFTKIAKDSAVKAKVVKVLDFCFFARVLPGIDAKCKLPFEDEVNVNDSVLIRILDTSVREDNRLEIKGKYIRHIIDYSKKPGGF